MRVRQFTFLPCIMVMSMVFAAAGAGGCSSSGHTGENKTTVESFQSTKAAVVKAQGRVDKTLAALNQLSSARDLQMAFDDYTNALTSLEDGAEEARIRAQTMRKNVDAYVANWQQEMETISDPSIKANLEQRREAVKANFQDVQKSAQAVREAYQPFILNLRQIRKAVSMHLSPDVLPSLKPAIDKANQQGQTLKQQIATLNGELDKISAGMSPGASGSGSK